MRGNYGLWIPVIAAMFIAGCGGGGGGGGQPTQTPSKVTVPLAVHIYLWTGDTQGLTSNVGCRLTQAQIDSYINSLLNNESLFGSNIDITHDPSTDEIIVYTDGTPDDRTIHSGTFYVGAGTNYWKPGHINIYFVGNVQDVVTDTALGITVDPDEALSYTPVTPMIIINDGGFELAIGFASSALPSQVLGYHPLEHEVMHYLGRFKSLTMEPGLAARVYDAGEHCDHLIGGGNNCLLRDVDPPPAAPLVVPGKESDVNTELGQINKRVKDQKWNDP